MAPGLHDRSIVLAAAGVFLAWAGCATSVESGLGEGIDFSTYHTWGWRIPEPAANEPPTDEERALGRAIAAEIDAVLSRRGLVFAGDESELFVTPELSVLRRQIVIHRAEADRFLPSLHSTPSYVIEGQTREEIDVVEEVSLHVLVAERETGRTVWRGKLRGTFDRAFAPHLEESVAALMASLPAAAPATEMNGPAGVLARAGRSGVDAADR